MTPTYHGSPVSGSLGRKDACAPGDVEIIGSVLHPATSPVDPDSHRLTFTYANGLAVMLGIIVE